MDGKVEKGREGRRRVGVLRGGEERERRAKTDLPRLENIR